MTLEKNTFQATLKKARAMKNNICIVEISNSQSEVPVKTRQSHNRRNIKITNEITCDYAQEQTAAPCCMSVFYNFKMSEND